MYVRKEHRITDREAIFSLMETRPLGSWVCAGPDGLVVNHVPFLLDRSRGANGTLIGHVSRANGIWRALTPATESVVVFQGPEAYITPGWYPGKADDGKVVPTWDYFVAHAHGKARVIEDRAWLLDLLNRLTDANESRQQLPWRVSDAPADYIDKLLRAVVGIEIPIDRLDAKLKASQDESMPDRLGTVRGLRALADPDARWMADLVQGAVEKESSPD